MVLTDQRIKEYLQEIGRRGGEATLERHGNGHFKDIRGKVVRPGWTPGKKRKARSTYTQEKKKADGSANEKEQTRWTVDE